MIFLLPFTPQDKVHELLSWALTLGGAKGHQLILMPSKKVRDVKELESLAKDSFDSTEILLDAEGIEGHPEGPNSMMRQAIWHMAAPVARGPWMYWEPDCIPLVPSWSDKWEQEYRAHNKPFMGEFRPASGVTPDYLSGNMVLPKDALLLAPMLARRGLSRDGVELAFDIVAASQTLPQAHLTKLLQQVPKNADGSSIHFPDQDSLKLLREGAVFFHPCKDGSLIEQLRNKQAGVSGLNVSAIHPPVENKLIGVAASKELAGIMIDIESLTKENDYLRAEFLKLKAQIVPTVCDVRIPKKKGRSPMTPEEKAKRSADMKAYWAKRKAKKK